MRVLFTSVVLVSVLAVGGLLAQSAGDTLWRPKTGPAPSLVPPGTPAPGSAESAAIAEVIAFEKATEAAVVRGDTAYLERALAPTFLFTHGDGWVDGGAPLKIDTKASWIEYVKRKPSPYIYRELDHQQVELHGDVAITLGRYFYLPQSNNGNAAHMHVWFERVYAKRNGQWQQLSHRTVKGPLRDDAARSTQ
ncbi:MAG TPA: nuclear transport factor 2 family protein [Vicinamibacterales bacterium]|nr:nuclear transport factor 2 family protein [Vicinamibacterales bacterium]